MPGERLPRPLYPVLKGLLLGADGSVWTVLEEEDDEYVTRLDPDRAGVHRGAGSTELASWQLTLLSQN